MDIIKNKLKSLPNMPGCYKFYDNSEKLLYIGKAKNLKKRVSSYFVKNNKDPKTRVLVGKISDVGWETTDSEMDALILEAKLIKKFLPPYNIKIKDDKSFLSVKIDFSQKYPRPELARLARAKPSQQAKIYGPFTDGALLRSGLKVLRRIFQWCDLSEAEMSRRQKTARPCFSYHLKNCSGVCAGKISVKEYGKNMKQLSRFFEGEKGSIVKELKREMTISAKNKDFEKAAKLRDKIKTLEHLGQNIQFSNNNLNIENSLKIEKLKIKNSQSALKELIKEINISLGTRLKFHKKWRIEFYDISNTSGTNAVGSMIVWQDGEFARDQYRKFKIKTVEGANDFGSLVEVLRRRIGRISKFKNQMSNKIQSLNVQNVFWPEPDIIILDGGKPQLSAVGRMFTEQGIDIPLLALAKEEEEVWGVNFTKPKLHKRHKQKYKFHKTQTVLNLQSEIFNLKSIAKDSPEGFFLQKIRDEAHRFAITFHRVLRVKKAVKSRLDEISGIGPKTKKKLLLRFGSVSGIMKASDKGLKNMIGEKLAREIKEKL
ncbi:excinuclease ABC subunit UvrC [Candidatus Microgenomates bacterium]|nr:excinuclease ABC subunit UvrC [Candidatus Microgenomates bacterium]